MGEWRVPLSDINFSEEEVAAVAETYRSGWLSQGPRVDAFERAFAMRVGARHAVAVSSGTAALHLIYVCAGLGPGDEVILPSLTFAATAAAIVHAGARPVFADLCGCERPWLSPDAAEALISPRTRAIVNVSYGGHPGELVELRELADRLGVVLVEDASHALGAYARGAHAGTVGLAGAFSFFANKNLALGEGGMIVTDDESLALRARALRSHGLTSDTWRRHRGEHESYDVLEPGFNYRLDEARAALGALVLGRLDRDNSTRAALALRYAQELAGLPGLSSVMAPDEVGVTNAWHIYPALLSPGADRARFRARLRERGVQTSIHYPPLHLTRAFAPYACGPLSVTETYAARTVTLPLFATMTEAQQAHAIAAVKAALSGRV